MMRLADFHFHRIENHMIYLHSSYRRKSKHGHQNRSNITDNDLSKCICVSFPLHETALIEDLDHLANQEYVSRSQYIRRALSAEKNRPTTTSTEESKNEEDITGRNKLYRVVDFHAKKAGLTADELVEVLIKREYRIK